MRIVYCNALFALLLLQASVIIEARDCVLCNILQHGKERLANIPRISANLSINGGLHISGGLESQSSNQPQAIQFPAREIQYPSLQRSAQRSLQVEAKIEIRHFTEADIEIDAKLKTVELIKKYGFPVETHFVTTEDGYKLCLHRMPRPGAQPILLVHGLMSSSAAFVMLGPSNGLAYILYLQGYDVWMLNTRGNIYSMEHTKKFISMKDYWDFSFHDIGVKDLPPSIDLILERTNYQQIQYIGHSQGSTVFFVMCSELPSYSSKVIIMQALSPPVFMKETRSPVLKFMSFFKGSLAVLFQQLGGYAVSLTTKLIDKFRHHICPANRLTSKICGMFDFVLCGFNWLSFNMTLTPIIIGHGSQGSATKLIHHYAQLHTKLLLHFRRYDYGPTINLIRYKSLSPPSYNLSQTQCKVVLHHGEDDWLASGSDVEKLQERLPNCIESRKVEFKSFSHFDFIISKDVRSLVYDRVVNVVVTNKIERIEPKTRQWSQVQSPNQISYQGDKAQNTLRYPDSDSSVQHTIHIRRQGDLQLGTNSNKQIQYQRQAQLEISRNSHNPIMQSQNRPQWRQVHSDNQISLDGDEAQNPQGYPESDTPVQHTIHIKRQGDLQLGTSFQPSSNKQIQYQRQGQLEISRDSSYNPIIQSQNIPQWSQGQVVNVQPFPNPDSSVQNSIHIKRQGDLQLGTSFQPSSNKQIQYQRQGHLEISRDSSYNPIIQSQNIPQWSQGQVQDIQPNRNTDNSVQNSIQIEKPIQINHFTEADIETDGKLDTVELIKKYGFPVETHFVTTEDGYKLCLHRMPRPGAQPILLVHGLMSSSAAWVMLGPSNGLAYILYLQGYDVWMLNTRGNIYSREHTNKFISMMDYWDFSFHDIGVKDLPPSIDLILERTNYQQIQYIGHSQGSTVFFVMCSELPSYSSKVIIMQALSPSVFMKDTRSPVLKFMGFFRGPLTMLLVRLGGYAVSITTKLIQQFRHHICPANKITSQICGVFDFVLCGFNWFGFNMTLTPIIVGHSSQGSSTKQIHHYAQLQKKLNFRRYDLGPTRNLIRYKSLSPPSYNLSQTQCKVVLHHGEDDWLSSGSDVANLQERLPNCIESRKVELKFFTHFDFIISKDVRPLVYDRVVNLAVTNK
ncbi:uncharacterized protein LOC117901386 isoform X2 [Drosophila subobscura]|uniref:uncharacterized protein LOC117901386 isoform X2 n=1 Tax=Drosophila subobscura TaxID=7241 RepID=UPI00155AB512|nr:uncharacterized protein LOC117901386 isoform X2 [Drosophila subobscura]